MDMPTDTGTGGASDVARPLAFPGACLSHVLVTKGLRKILRNAGMMVHPDRHLVVKSR